MQRPFISVGLPSLALVGVLVAVIAVQMGEVRAAVPVVQGVTDTSSTFVEHAPYIHPGLPAQRRAMELRNPHEGDAKAVSQGKSLFVNYNCLDCHGADGSGAMGPSLQDGRWHFGGSAGEVFESIYQGRPDGMPAWGSRISDDQIWLLVSYVRSLPAGHDVTTEDFQGKTEERTGH